MGSAAISQKEPEMTDIHCHILPGMDDGPRTLEESKAICRCAMDNGITRMAVTPHITELDDIDRFTAARDEKLELLRSALREEGLGLELYPGAEVYISDDVFYADRLERLAINGGRYILVEFLTADLTVTRIMRYIDELRNAGLEPVVAHPERYRYFQRDISLINIFTERGVLFQINSNGFHHDAPRAQRELALAMIRTGSASFIATDSHSLRRRPPNLLECLQSLPDDIYPDMIAKMVGANPLAVIENNDVSPEVKAPLRKKSWFKR
jgi:protein-tyrosine phosphatase